MSIGIPTTYKGRNFRSRLEARWAAFFDLLGWRYEYEPVDFDGWIPDFLINENCPVFVEVKPIREFCEATSKKIVNATPKKKISDYLGKEYETPEYELLLVGCVLPEPDSWSRPAIGWLYETISDYGWGLAPFGRWESQLRLGFCHGEGNFHDRISGQYDGGHYGTEQLDHNEPKRLWAKAGNRTQWRAAKR